jgi:hypothetical protein
MSKKSTNFESKMPKEWLSFSGKVDLSYDPSEAEAREVQNKKILSVMTRGCPHRLRNIVFYGRG